MSSHDLTAPTGNKSRGSQCAAQAWDTLLIFAVGMAAFTVSLPQEFIGLDARYAMFAKEMLRNGPSLFPTTYLGPYPAYPATIILPIYWLAQVFGGVTPFTAVFPTAFVSAGILVLIYKIAALRSRKWGYCAVCLTFLTFAFVRASRRVSPDQYTALVTSACFYIVYSAHNLETRRRLWLLPILLVVGYACRGPIGLIVPGGVLCAFYFFNGKMKTFSLVSVGVLTLLIACSAALLAAAEHQGGKAFAERVLTMEALGRMHGGERGFHYYWTTGFVSYACVFPLAVVSLCGQWKRITERKDTDSRLLYSLVVWAVVVLVGLSIPGEKKARYILPIVPPLALIAAHMFIGPAPQRALTWTRENFQRLCTVLPFVAGVGCACRGLVAQFMGAGEDMFLGRAIVCTASAAGAALIPMGRVTAEKPMAVRSLAVGAMSLFLINVGIVEPIRFLRERSGPFVESLEALQLERERRIVFYRIGPDQGDIVLAANYKRRFVPTFVDSPSGLMRRGVGACVIARKEDAAALRQTQADRKPTGLGLSSVTQQQKSRRNRSHGTLSG